jgi:hypothetical protein
MTLDDYFEKTRGVGILATADAEGKVNAALYGRPHVLDDRTIALIAGDRLTHANLLVNPSAVYLFKEEGAYRGKRLYLTKIREEKDSPLIEALRRRKVATREDHTGNESKFLIYFTIDQVRPLSGEEAPVAAP